MYYIKVNYLHHETNYFINIFIHLLPPLQQPPQSELLTGTHCSPGYQRMVKKSFYLIITDLHSLEFLVSIIIGIEVAIVLLPWLVDCQVPSNRGDSGELKENGFNLFSQVFLFNLQQWP